MDDHSLELDPQSPVPLYRQLADRLGWSLASGAIRPGDRLPTVRQLAARSRVNRNTAARAVVELEREGLVTTRVGRGTFAADPSAARCGPPRAATIDAALDRLLVEARRCGLSLEELGWRLRQRIEAFRRGAPATDLDH